MAKPKKRSALEVLTKKRLAQLARAFELDLPASRAKAELVDVLGSSKNASFAAILAELNRAELEDICRAHELDDSGKEKARIAARILGTEPAAKPKARAAGKKTRTGKGSRKTKKAKKSGNGNGNRGVLGFEVEHSSMADPLRTHSGQRQPERRGMNSFSEKVSFIWSVADLLRGDYKPSEYGRVMLPFLVLRRLDQVLASTRKAVLEADAKFPADKVPEALRERMLLKASGETFYNTSKLDFTAMLDDANNAAANLSGYVHGFSKNVRDIMENE